MNEMYSNQSTAPMHTTNNSTAASVKKSSLYHIGWIILSAALIILPLIFIPSPLFAFGLTKTLILSLATIISITLVLLGALKEGVIQLPKHPIYLSAIALPFVYLLSAVFSGTFSRSLMGSSFEIDTVTGVLLLSLLLIAIPLMFTSKKKILTLYAGLFISFLLVALFQALKMIVGGNALSFGVLFSNIGNTVGKWNDFGALAGLFALISLITLELPLKRTQQVILYAVLALSLAFLAIVNFTLVWVILGVFSLLFFIYTFSFGLIYSKTTAERGQITSYVPIRSLIVFLISLVFIIAGGPLGNAISSLTSVSQIEARPSWQATFEIAGDAFKENPFLGIGPNNFTYQWLLNKPDGINSTIFWNTDFTVGIGTIPSALVTVGILGLLAWATLLILFLWIGFKNIGRTENSDPMYAYLEISSFLAAIYGWILLIAYVPNIVISAFTFLFMGVFLAVQYQKGVIGKITLSGTASPRQAFLVTFIVITFLIGGVAWGYVTVSRYIASLYFQNALLTANQGGTIDDIELNIQKATRLYTNDDYFRTLSEVYLLRLTQVVNQEGVSEDVLRTQFQNVLSGAVGYAQNAIAIDPRDYKNWMMLGQVYASIVPLGVEGAYESAVASYKEAQTLNPSNPSIDLIQARLELSQNRVDAAKENIYKALNKKNNFTEAVFFLSQIEAATGNIDNAITAAQSAAILSPNDPTVFFQLGILHYTKGSFTEAVSALERAVILLPTYANAKYFLGLAYYQVNQREEAIAQFEDVLTLNPDNQEVMTILENMRAGIPPLTGLTPPAPEDREELPIEEE